MDPNCEPCILLRPLIVGELQQSRKVMAKTGTGSIALDSESGVPERSPCEAVYASV